MRPVFTVFADDGPLIVKIRMAGFEPLVDRLHGGDFAWMHAHFKDVPHRLFDHEKYEVYSIALYDYEEPPSFAVHFNRGDDIDDVEWELIGDWVKRYICEGKDGDSWKETNAAMPSVMDDMEKPVKQLGEGEDWTVFGDKIIVEENEMGTVRREKVMKDSYEFKMMQVGDTMFYEVWKPFTCNPYTTYVEGFGEKGHFPFFTNLYVNTTWGLGQDNAFMVQLWTHLGMKGECELERMVRARCERCREGKEGEPSVYRLGLEECIKSRERKEELKRKRVAFK